MRILRPRNSDPLGGVSITRHMLEEMDRQSSPTHRLPFVADDDILSTFLEPGCDPHDMAVSLSGHLDRLRIGMERTSDELRNECVSVLPTFEQHVTRMDEMERQVQKIQSQVTLLLSDLESLREKLMDPYNQISQRLILLHRLKATCDLIRKVIRLQNLSKRILSQTSFDTKTVAGMRELEKSANALRDFDSILESDPDVKRIREVQNLKSLVDGMRGMIIDKCDT